MSINKVKWVSLRKSGSVRKAALIFSLFLFVLSSFPLRISDTRQIFVGMGYNLWLYNWSSDVNCIDRPILGYYNSTNATILEQHIQWFHELDMNFVLIAWQGVSYNAYVNQNTFLFFNLLGNYSGNRVQACICVEKTGPETNASAIYDYIYSNFTLAYPSCYFYLYGKPLIVFFSVDSTIFNVDNPLSLDSRFTVRTMGNHANDNWLYENFANNGGITSHCRQIPVIPRFDNSHITNPPRDLIVICDAKLSWLYKSEWNRAVKCTQNNSIDVVTISWWNEFAERSEVEPHYDATAYSNDPFLLFNITKEYIARLRGSVVPSSSDVWYNSPISFGLVMLSYFFAMVFIRGRRR
jgi:hypothetical protein